MATLSVLITVGVVVIGKRKLTYENTLVLEDEPPGEVRRTLFYFVAAAFVASALVAVITALQGNHRKHARWAIRHVALGLWVSLQRIVFGVLMVGMRSWQGNQRVDAQTTRDIFAIAGLSSIAACIAIGEMVQVH